MAQAPPGLQWKERLGRECGNASLLVHCSLKNECALHSSNLACIKQLDSWEHAFGNYKSIYISLKSHQCLFSCISVFSDRDTWSNKQKHISSKYDINANTKAMYIYKLMSDCYQIVSSLKAFPLLCLNSLQPSIHSRYLFHSKHPQQQNRLIDCWSAPQNIKTAVVYHQIYQTFVLACNPAKFRHTTW